jgi:hypothetical protein
MKRLTAITLSLFLGACAGYSGRGLVPGVSGMDEVVELMGAPRMQWAETDGSQRLAFPRGPMGVHTYMVEIGPEGKLRRIENVMSPAAFSRIRAGMSKDQVRRILGPEEPSWTQYFKARDELVWEWRYCDDGNQLARFNVLFDGTREVVRSSMSIREDLINDCEMRLGCWCSH